MKKGEMNNKEIAAFIFFIISVVVAAVLYTITLATR